MSAALPVFVWIVTVCGSQNDDDNVDKMYFSERLKQLEELQVCRTRHASHATHRHCLYSTDALQADEKRLEGQQKQMQAELARMRQALVRSNLELEQVPHTPFAGAFSAKPCR